MRNILLRGSGPGVNGVGVALFIEMWVCIGHTGAG